MRIFVARQVNLLVIKWLTILVIAANLLNRFDITGYDDSHCTLLMGSRFCWAVHVHYVCTCTNYDVLDLEPDGLHALPLV